MKPQYIDAVRELVSGNVGGICSGPISQLKFYEGQTPPTEEEIQSKLVELQAEYDAKQYQRDRAEAYPSFGDQLDYIFHHGIEKWKTDVVQPVKDANPKPT